MHSLSNGTDHSVEGNNNHIQSKEKSESKTLSSVNVNKRKRDEFKYGNYRNYYYKRIKSGGLQTDLRLDMIAAHPQYFRNKSVLDIGSNAGFVTMNLARKLQPASILGIDIDGSLIDEARRELEKEKADGSISSEEKEALKHVNFRKVS